MEAECYDALVGLGVTEVTKEWVDCVFSNNFVGTSASWPLEERNPAEIVEYLQTVLACSNIWQHGKTEDGFWTFISDKNVSCRSLIAVLQYYLDSADDMPESAAYAAGVYLNLIKIPGAGSRQLQQPMITRAVVLLVLSRWKPRTKAKSANSSRAGKRKAVSPLKADKGKRSFTGGDGGLGGPVAAHHVMFALFENFVQALTRYKISIGEDLIEQTIGGLLTLARLDWDSSDDVNSKNNPVSLAYQGLESFLNKPENTRFVFKHLVDTITMRSGPTASTTIPKYIQKSRKQAEEFICGLVQNKYCLPGIRLLVQHSCTKTPDKVTYRTHVAESLANIVLKLPISSQSDLMGWIARYSRNNKAGYRVFALELANFFLQAQRQIRNTDESTKVPSTPAKDIDDLIMDEDDSNEKQGPLVDPHEVFLELLVGRMSDKAPTVRAKAISIFASLVSIAASGNNDGLLDLLKQRIVCNAPPLRSLSTPGGVTHAAPPPARSMSSPAGSAAAENIIHILVRRATDERGAVRKAAIACIEELMNIPSYTPGDAEIKAVHKACLDSALSVRKQGLISLTAALNRFPKRPDVQDLWLDGALPLTIDKEEGVSKKAVEIMEELLIFPIIRQANQSRCELSWTLLRHIDDKHDLRRYLQRLCKLWDRAGLLKQELFDFLIGFVTDPDTNGGWAFMSDIAACRPDMVDVQKVLTAWQDRDLDNVVITGHILSTISHVSSRIPKETCKELVSELKDFLIQFTVPTGSIAAMMTCIVKLDARISDQNSSQKQEICKNTKTFAGNLLTASEQKLSGIIFSDDPIGTYDQVAVVRQLFTMGEASLIAPESMTTRHELLVNALVARDTEQTEGRSSPLKGTHPPAVRAHAILTLGKLCLQNEELSKKSITTMARELEECTEPAVRNNIVIVMTDLCVRHPNYIQPYLGSIASCLRDETALVRRQTIILLTRLLQEEYVKMKGVLFFRIMATVVDKDESVRRLAEFCVANSLLSKNSGLFTSNFIECIYHFNNVQTHAAYNKFKQTDYDMKQFSFAGISKQNHRLRIYNFMLSNMNDFDKLQTSQRVCQEILSPIAEGEIQVANNTEMEGVLKDALRILASEDMKLRTRAVDDAEDDTEMAAKANAAKATLITKVVKKNVVENIVPIVIGLKAFLEKTKSPIMKQLMLYLRQLFHDYKSEVEEILANDKQLSTEILFDIRKFEEARSAMEDTPKSRRGSFSSPVLRDATPSATTLVLTPLLSRTGSQKNTPSGSPAFTAPRLRASVAASRRRSSGIPNSPSKSGAKGSPLAWVRTPSGKNVSDKVIKLQSPLVPMRKKQWKVQPPAYNINEPKTERNSGATEENKDPQTDTIQPRKRGRSRLSHSETLPPAT
eukprot:m.6441 g.6441  ORF g.6441 m.6441 type:complete len:1373 (+) comp3533_c0_seq2:124-4242(+)